MNRLLVAPRPIASWRWLWIAPVAAIFLSPLVYGLIRFIAENTDAPEWLEKAHFARVFSRVLAVVSILLAVVIFLSKNKKGARLPVLASIFPARWFRPCFLGLIVGSLCAGSIAAFDIMAGARVWHPDGWLQASGGILATACIVACIEEIFFRGFILRELAAAMSWQKAVFVQAAIFSSVHFLSPSGSFGACYQVTPFSGLDLAASLLTPFCSGAAPWVKWCSLFLIAVTLGAAMRHPSGLWWCVGFHAALILGEKSLPRLTKFQPEHATVFSSEQVTSGLFCAVLFSVVATLIFVRAAQKETNTHAA